MDKNWKKVGTCPHCGSPIYAPKIYDESHPPKSFRTCDCMKNIGDVSKLKNLVKEGKAREDVGSN